MACFAAGRNPRRFQKPIRQLHALHWVVYCKPPFGGPDHVLRYLGAYTHRVAISNHRIVSFADDEVTFRRRDSAHKNKKRILTLPVDEFLRRFLLHVLPRGFVRIRHFGFLASRRRGTTASRAVTGCSPTHLATDSFRGGSPERREMNYLQPRTCPSMRRIDGFNRAAYRCSDQAPFTTASDRCLTC